MKVYVPFTNMAQGVAVALDATGWPCAGVYVGGSDTAYWELMSHLWDKKEAFAIVEHDVLVRPQTFDELVNCSNDWCAFTLPYLRGEYPGMGCVKFSHALITAIPDAFQRMDKLSYTDHSPHHWCTVDNSLQECLRAAGFTQCVHQPALIHLRDYEGVPQPTHGCC